MQTAEVNMKKAVIAFLFFIQFFHLTALDVYKKPHQYVQQSWTVKNGLPSNEINDVTRTSEGFVWAATNSGLARLDGVSVKVFNKANVRKFNENNFSRIAKGADDNLYVLDSAGGIFVLEEKGFFSVVSAKDIPGKNMRDMTATSDFRILTASSEGLFVYDIKKEKLAGYSVAEGLPGSDVRSICTTPEGKIIGGTSEGSLFRLEKGEISVDGFSEFRGDAPVTALFCENSKVFVGIQSKGLYTVSDEGVKKIPLSSDNQNWYTVTDMVKDIEGTLWASTAASDLLRIPPDTSEALMSEKNNRVIHTHINGLHYDKSDKLWVAAKNGVHLLRDGFFSTTTTSDGISGNLTYGVLKDSRDRLWVGTRGNGLNIIENGNIRRLGNKNGVPGPLIGGIHEDKNKNIWVGTSKGLLLFKEGDLDRRQVFTENHGLKKNVVSAIFHDSRERLWIGTLGGHLHLLGEKGLIRLVKEGTPFEGNTIHSIKEDGEGNIWVAASDGLHKGSRGKFKTYSEDEFFEDIPLVLHVDRDTPGTIWIGTQKNGLVRFYDNSFLKFDSRRGLVSDTVFSIVEDNDGALWLGTLRGVVRFEKKLMEKCSRNDSKKIVTEVFDTSDGLLSLQCTGGVQQTSFYSEGKVYISTMEGLAKGDTSSFSPGERYKNVKLKITGASADGIQLENDGKISHKTERLNFSFSVPCFYKPESLSVKYRLSGFDNRWREAGTERSVTYTNISPGKYEFLLKLEENGETENISFTIKSPWYSKWYYFLPVFLLFIFYVLKKKSKKHLSRKETDTEKNTHQSSKNKDSDEKYEKSRMDEDVCEQYFLELEELMNEKKPYKNPELTLPELASELSVSRNVLSQVINSRDGEMNFYSYINSYRLRDAENMLSDTKMENRNILDIAYEAGFKSKTSFNTFFKKETGMTPSQYRKKFCNNKKSP